MTLAPAYSSIFTPRDRRPMWEWAHDHLDMPSVLTKHGKFDISESRHFIGPMAALQDERVRQVAIRKPVRGGGTLISDVWHCWCRACDPGPALAVMQSDDMAKKHAEERLMVMMKQTGRAIGMMPENRHQDRTSDIVFADGIPFTIIGPAINKLQSRGRRYISCDEPWLYRPGVVVEAEGRLGDFQKTQTSKLLLVSQAGQPEDDFDLKFMEGSQETWWVPCLSCEKHFDPRWTIKRRDGSLAGMRWDRHVDDRGHWLVEKCLDSVRYECPHCGTPMIWGPRVKSEWNRLGQYVAKNPEAARSKKSFHWNALIDTPWVSLVEQFLNAMNAMKLGQYGPLVQFFQKKMAEPKNEASVLDDQVDVMKKTFEIAEKWEAEDIRIATTDRQAEHYWLMICAWSKLGECRRLLYQKCHSYAEMEKLCDEYKATLWLQDAGFEATGDLGVYSACASLSKPGRLCIATKGDQKPSFTRKVGKTSINSSYADMRPVDPERGQGKKGRLALLVLFSSDRIADSLQAQRSSGRWVDPANADENDPNEVAFEKQMRGERKVMVKDKATGRPKWIWKRFGENHAWDCAKQQVLGATMRGILPDISAEANVEAAAT